MKLSISIISTEESRREPQESLLQLKRILLLIFILLLWQIQTGCTTAKYFDISEERIKSSKEFRYAFFSVKQEIMWSNDTASINDPKFEAFYKRERQILEPFFGFKDDTDKTYWGL
jgi:hypothetical protein